MTVTRCSVRRGAYYDSLVLMQLQRSLVALPGVVDAGVVMATATNRELLAVNDLLPEGIVASPDDLLIVVKAADELSAGGAIDGVDILLGERRASVSEEFQPRSLRAATRQLPEARWVLVSVPGRYAAGVAREALELGRHVFLYSDNVSLEDEISLKGRARDKGLLVMGPDCGTAIINGVGLGFANRLRRGSISLVGASGTGIQAVSSRIHSLGGGISHAVGTGSRDLKSEVGAITAHQAMDLLDRDPQTEVIVLISKPPAASVARGLLAAAQEMGTPVVVDFIGYPAPARKIGNVRFAASLSDAADIAMQLLASRDSGSGKPSSGAKGYLRGLFSGGTLAYEALLGLQTALSPLFSNSPLTDDQLLEDPLRSEAHTIIDLGDEFFMVGRLHPMIDNDLRVRRLRQEAANPEVGMLLLDVVLGQGSHPDPAGELAPVIKEIRGKRADIEIVVVLIGTDDDPQDAQSQIRAFTEAGAEVFRTVTEAVDHVSLRFAGNQKPEFPPVARESLSLPLAAINVGLESFHESLIAQGAQAVQVDWRPPAGGNEALASLLARMKR